MKYFKLLLSIFFLVESNALVAQVFSKEFGKIGKDDIELTQCSFEKSAEAVVLYDIGKSYFVETEYSFELIFERSTKVKILSNAGIKWAEVEIPFYHEGDIFEKVYDIEAFTYNFMDGKLTKTPLNQTTCQVEKINQYWSNKKFAMPEVKAGSIIEFKYKIHSQYIFNFRDWEFQWRIPVVYSEYQVKLIPFYEYTWLVQGTTKFDVFSKYEDTGLPRRFGSPGPYLNNNEYHDMVYEFGLKNVPSFSNEEYITTRNDYIIKIDFQLSKVTRMDGSSYSIITTWPELIKDYLKNEKFGKYIKKSEGAAAKLFDIKSIELKSQLEKFDEIVSYVKRNYNWNKTFDKYTWNSVADFIKKKEGNVTEINLFLTGLLRSVGVDAYPVLISTREHGKIKYDYPYNHFFNYVIVAVKINDNILLADATEILSANDRIPPRSINDKGLSIIKDKVEWIPLQFQFLSETKTDIAINISEKKLIAKADFSANEYDALHYRNKYGENSKKIIDEWISDNYNLIDSSLIIKNQININEPYIVSFKVENNAEIINDKIYVSPFLNEVVSDNPFKQLFRTYPVDFVYPMKRTFKSEINIPEGYKIDYLPKEYELSNNLFEMSYKIKSDDKMVTISFSYYLKNSVYPPEHYQKVKYFFDEIVKRGNEKTVFVKK